MKTFLWLSIVLLQFGCSAIKHAYIESKNENVRFFKNRIEKLKYTNEGRPVINVNVNGKTKICLIDTGSPTFVFLNSSYISEFEKTEHNYYASRGLKRPDRSELTTHTFIMDSVSSNLFIGWKKTSMVLNQKINQNCDGIILSSVLGNDTFLYSQYPIYYDFTNSIIKTLDETFDKKEFVIIESKFKVIGSKMLIKLSLNNSEYWFTFDTGYNGFIHLSKHELGNKIAEIDNAISFVDGKLKINRASIFSNIDIKISDLDAFKGQVLSFSNVKSDLIGMEFIRNFDWIIDYPNEQIYLKPNYNFKSIDNSFKDYTKFKYKSKIIDGEIVIVAKSINKNNKKYNIGDVIISIDNKRITHENICDMQELLSNTDDWNSFTLDIKKIKTYNGFH